jgi:hypothetical protein
MKNQQYKASLTNSDELSDVTAILKKKGFTMVSEQPITKSGIIREYQFWLNSKLDKFICLEVWKNDTVIIFNQITINEI